MAQNNKFTLSFLCVSFIFLRHNLGMTIIITYFPIAALSALFVGGIG